jgi:hypothetical protein
MLSSKGEPCTARMQSCRNWPSSFGMAGGARVGRGSTMLLDSSDGVEVDLIFTLFTLDASSGYLNRRRRRPLTLAESRTGAWQRTSCAIGLRQ